MKSPIVNGCSKFEQILMGEIAKSPIVNGCSNFERVLKGEKVKSPIVNGCSKIRENSHGGSSEITCSK